VGRDLAARTARRWPREVEDSSSVLATRLLDGAARWEDEGVNFETVTAQVHALLGVPGDFPIVAMEEFPRVDPEGGGRVDDD
jgi:hypothetical protein